MYFVLIFYSMGHFFGDAMYIQKNGCVYGNRLLNVFSHFTFSRQVRLSVRYNAAHVSRHVTVDRRRHGLQDQRNTGQRSQGKRTPAPDLLGQEQPPERRRTTESQHRVSHGNVLTQQRCAFQRATESEHRIHDAQRTEPEHGVVRQRKRPEWKHIEW